MKQPTRQEVLDAFVYSIISFITVIPLILQKIDPSYLQLIPIISERIFDHLIQISATILGFTLVGIFYHLGKLDEKKKVVISQLATKKATDSKYPKNDLRPEDNERLYELVYTSRRVRTNTAIISGCFGLAITLSLICLIYFKSGVGQTLIFTIIALMLAPIFFFNRFWRDELLI
jgi:hypothetical protein